MSKERIGEKAALNKLPFLWLGVNYTIKCNR